jgi:hypothetical protein
MSNSKAPKLCTQQCGVRTRGQPVKSVAEGPCQKPTIKLQSDTACVSANFPDPELLENKLKYRI